MANAAQQLQRSWIWVPEWHDESTSSSGRLVTFTRRFYLSSSPAECTLFCSADTRYKLVVNSKRIGLGPSRSCSKIWYYDERSITSLLVPGENVITFQVWRLFPGQRTGFSFARTILPGLTVVGSVSMEQGAEVNLGTKNGEWEAEVHGSISFPSGLEDDFFLHIYERYNVSSDSVKVTPISYHLNLGTGEMTPWNLAPRLIPFQEDSPAAFKGVSWASSGCSSDDWSAFAAGEPIQLPARTCHQVHLQAQEHYTAFVKWIFGPGSQGSRISIKYSESYEDVPTLYPWHRRKGIRTDASRGRLYGPSDVVKLPLDYHQRVEYEPFWFRTFRFISLDIETGPAGLNMQLLEPTQVNYPLQLKAACLWDGDGRENQIWDISIRTLRNCMFDGYSDCPYYEQLQYAEDTRSSGIFHYLLSGDDRLMRQAMLGFASSTTKEGLIQARYPSHVGQVIPGFALFWVLQVTDHHLFFNDEPFTRTLLPVIDLVMSFFRKHVDHRGLVANLPSRYWQFVDWADGWKGTPDHPDGGVPVAGRSSNTYTFANMLFIMVIDEVAKLYKRFGRQSSASDLDQLAATIRSAVNHHCYDGEFYTDSTIDQGRQQYSQHAQLMAVLSGAADGATSKRILRGSFIEQEAGTFAKCSYVMMYYAFRAFSMAGRDLYNNFWRIAWDPWKGMLDKDLMTWEEDPVTQRSDCHAWGSVAIHEYITEVAGLKPLDPGWQGILFTPRIELADNMTCSAALGAGNTATVSWRTKDGVMDVQLELQSPCQVVSSLPSIGRQQHGLVKSLRFTL